MPGVKGQSSALIAAATQTSFFGIKTIITSEFARITQASSMSEAKQKLANGNVDLLIINTPLGDEFGVESALSIASHTGNMGIMLLVRPEQYEQVSYRTRGTGIFVLTKPLKGQVLTETVRLMQRMHERVADLEKENMKLRRRLDEMTLVTRAKCLLIERRGMTEEEAHHYLEKDAMDYSRTKKESAQAVIREMEE